MVWVRTFDNLSGNTHHHRVGWDRVYHYCVGPDSTVITNRNCTKHFGPCSNNHPIPYGGMPFAFFQAGSTEGYAMVDCDIRADLGGFSNNNTHAMVNEKAGTDYCAGMD